MTTQLQDLAEWYKENSTEEERAKVRADLARQKELADPITYARLRLRNRLTPDQKRVYASVVAHKKTIVRSGHGIGKTHGAAGLVLWFYETFQPSIVLTTAPVWSSVRDLLWQEIYAQVNRVSRFPTTLSSGTYDFPPIPGYFVDFDQGIPLVLRNRAQEFHYAKGHNARTSEGFQGRHGSHLFIVLDEGAGVPKHIWDASNTMLQSEDCRILVIGNPTTTSGPYYEASTSRDWNVLTVSTLDHPNIHYELAGLPAPVPAAVRLSWVEDMISKHSRVIPASEKDQSCFEWPPSSGTWREPDDEFRIRVLGLGPLLASNAVWAEEWITKARDNAIPFSKLLQSQIQIGVDVARYGSDKTTVFTRIGPKITTVTASQRTSIPEVTGLAINALNQACQRFEKIRDDIPVAVDDDGVGGGVTDLLLEQGVRAYGISAATEAFWANSFPNRRSELWFTGREYGRKGMLDLSELDNDTYTDLKADLLAPVYSFDSKGRRVVEPKQMMKKRLGRSPDFADGFNLCMIPPFLSEYDGAFRGEFDDFFNSGQDF